MMFHTAPDPCSIWAILHVVLTPPPAVPLPACTPDGAGITYNEHINVALAVAMPDGGLITPVLKDADSTDLYQVSAAVLLEPGWQGAV